ncbi:nucleotidyltransferase family protein [Streptococcus panodentis]|uniref:Nucleotidyltransferase family protein n=1 Tax=Streptococcus panodentis TaxID=1581472 RepID=A0ABS5AXL2_9STRE|nr:nucleotidyltransferase family protein [Streptococcus panodentis]MBP2620996.1 hypothetical protein [Streptococcus panodentis]
MDRDSILRLLAADRDMMTILQIIAGLGLQDCWLTAGSVRNFIWNALSNRPAFDADTDVDVIFFDPAVSYEETMNIEEGVKEQFPQYKWEVKNQVYMHVHSPGTVPYRDARDAMSKYPERCTAVGLRLRTNGELQLFAPYGLEDILNFQVRPTPHFLENPERRELYTARLSKKNWQEKWPRLEIERP